MDSVTVSTVKSVNTVVVAAGETAVLPCISNDYNHNFAFWLFGNDKVVSPENYYDEGKYKYEELSGKLYINHVTPAESGFYKCVSKKLDGTGLSVGEVEMIVSDSTFSSIDAVKIVAIVSIILLISSAVP